MHTAQLFIRTLLSKKFPFPQIINFLGSHPQECYKQRKSGYKLLVVATIELNMGRARAEPASAREEEDDIIVSKSSRSPLFTKAKKKMHLARKKRELSSIFNIVATLKGREKKREKMMRTFLMYIR